MSDHEILRLELSIVVDLLAVAADLHGRVRPRHDTTDEHGQLGALLVLMRDRAGQLHQRAGIRPRAIINGDAFDRPHREG